MTESTMPAVAEPAMPTTVGALSHDDAPASGDNAEILTRLDAMNAQLTAMAKQVAAMESARERWAELVETLVPVSRGAVDLATVELQRAQDKGYLMFARESAAIADKVVSAYSEQDMRALGDNVVTILDAVKELTQPEVMALLNRTAQTIQEVEDSHDDPPSMFALARSMRDPQTRRGLARLLSMLHTVGEEQSTTSAPQSGPPGR